MGGFQSVLEDWLEQIGYDLGYDIENYPEMSQWENIKVKRIYRRSYGKSKSSTNTK